MCKKLYYCALLSAFVCALTISAQIHDGVKESVYGYDFTYINEESNTLYQTGTDLTHKLIVFYEPDCSDCSEAIDWLSSNKIINRLMEDGKLIIMAIRVSPQGKTKAMPGNWICGYSPDADDNYKIPAVPSLHLLRPDNRVVFEDIIDVRVLVDYMKKELKASEEASMR